MRLLSDLHEEKVAEDIGGKRAANSGAGVLKGDTFNQKWCLECKASLSPEAKIDKGLIIKTASEARTRQKQPAISLMHISGKPRIPKSLRIEAYVYLIPVPLRNKKQRYTELPMTHTIDEWLAMEGKTLRFRLPPGVPQCWRISTPASAKVRLSEQ